MHTQYFSTILTLIAVTLPLWLWSRSVSNKKFEVSDPNAKWKIELAHALLYAYFIGLISLTLLPYSRYTNPVPAKANIVPFVRGINDLKDIIQTHTLHMMLPHLVENLLGNVILFIPYGFLVPVCFSRMRSFGRVMLAGMLTSALIEVLQYLSRVAGIYRTADIDDIILNTSGAVVGYIAYYVVVIKRQRLYLPELSRKELTT